MRQISNAADNPEPGVRMSMVVMMVTIATIVIGMVCLVIGAVMGPIVDFWLAIVVLFLVFSGISQGMLAWTAAFRIAQARWAPTVIRVGHSAIYMLPVLYLVLVTLLIALKYYMPWVGDVPEGKGFYLNVPFMVARDLIAVAVIALLEFMLVRRTLTVDAKIAGGEEVTEAEQHRLNVIAVVVAVVYTIVSSIIAYDFIMAFSPEWVSTMFAPYFWITNMYAGLAVMIIISGLLQRPLARTGYLGPRQFTDMGNLMLGFSLFSMGLFFAQYLTIWYENLPYETPFLIIRYMRGPWLWLGWTAFIIEFAVPFIILQSRLVKRTPRYEMPVAGIAVIGFILERYVLVIPSMFPGKLLIAVLPLLGVLAFTGVFMLAVVMFLRRYPTPSAAQAIFPEPVLLEELD